MRVFIPGNVPSSKNSRVWTGRFSVESAQTKRYVKESQNFYLKYAKDFREVYDRLPKPVRISFKFIRKSKHKFDYHNAIQICTDLMQDPPRPGRKGYSWIAGDDADCMKAEFEYYEYDPLNPGVWIEIIE